MKSNNLENVKIQLRTDSIENWTTYNPILKYGELAIVIDEDGNERLKIGNGISSFNDLKYFNQNKFESEFIQSKDLQTKSLTQGYNNKATPTSIATGIFTEADGDFGVVHGIEAKILSSDNYAFVFNGQNLPGITERYTSHGEGTFNINAKTGLSGIYIGEQTLADIVKETQDVFKSITLIKPYSESNAYVQLEIADNASFTNAIVIDSNINNEYFIGFSSGTWCQQGLEGFGVKYNNNPIEIKFREILNNNDIITTELSKFYVKYRWYNLIQDEKHFSDYYSLVVPTSTEAGANSRDVVSKRDFTKLENELHKDTCHITEYGEYGKYEISPYCYNVIDQTIDDLDGLVLSNYSSNITYNIRFQTSSNDNDVHLKFYADYGNGPEFLAALDINNNSFMPDTRYDIRIVNDCIIIDKINGKDLVNYIKDNSNSVTLKFWN